PHIYTLSHTTLFRSRVAGRILAARQDEQAETAGDQRRREQRPSRRPLQRVQNGVDDGRGAADDQQARFFLGGGRQRRREQRVNGDRKSTRLNSSHVK